MAVVIGVVPDVVVGPTAADVADGSGARLPAGALNGRRQTRTLTGNASVGISGRPQLLGAVAGGLQQGGQLTLQLPTVGAAGSVPIGFAYFEFYGDFLVEMARLDNPSGWAFWARAKGTATAPYIIPGVMSSTTTTDANNPTNEKISGFRITSRDAGVTTAHEFFYYLAGE